MKRKFIVAAAYFVAALFINVYLSTIVFQLVGGSFNGFSRVSFIGGLKSIMSDSTHQTIFCCIQIFVVLGLVLLIVSRVASTSGKMNKITADIKTPAIAGQKQHGSARWQTKREIYKNFDVARLDKNDPFIKKLIEHGYDDLEFFAKEW